MSMKKIITLSIILAPLVSLSQNEWNSTNNATNAMYRTGYVAIGTSSAVASIPFVVKNSSAGQGTKVLFGAESFLGTQVVADALLQLQSASASSLDLKGSVAAGKNTSAVMKVSTSGFEMNYGSTGLTAIPFVISGNGAERFRITPTGQVGIGTGSAALGTCKLAVEGMIGCRELKVTLATAWTDYVFAKKYERLNFTQLENYIAQNNHLPNLTSAKEIEKEGTFNVGQTQVEMLRSLEELYLYVLELKKENETLKKDIEILKSK
jgi:hypothetical protein